MMGVAGTEPAACRPAARGDEGISPARVAIAGGMPPRGDAVGPGPCAAAGDGAGEAAQPPGELAAPWVNETSLSRTSNSASSGQKLHLMPVVSHRPRTTFLPSSSAAV